MPHLPGTLCAAIGGICGGQNFNYCDRSIILEDRDTCDACLRVCAKQNLVEEMGIGLREFSWPDRWWISEENKMIEAADTEVTRPKLILMAQQQSISANAPMYLLPQDADTHAL